MDEKKDKRVPFVLQPSLLQRLDDWRFAHHIGSRAEAIRQLIEDGLDRAERSEKKPGASHRA